jgi:hypothetical protein
MAEAELLLDTKMIQAMSDAQEYARGEKYCQRGRVRNLNREDLCRRRELCFSTGARDLLAEFDLD